MKFPCQLNTTLNTSIADSIEDDTTVERGVTLFKVSFTTVYILL